MTQKWTHCYQLKPGRWVFVPTDEARETGYHIKRAVEAHWKPPHFYFHLRAGGHVSAVRSHISSKFFFRADIDDFFGRVNRSRVTRCLKSWLSYVDARQMASESVVRRPSLEGFVLPYGFVQSPILASLALDQSKLGSYLRKLKGHGDLKVSVYVDDIIVSGQDEQELNAVAEKLVQTAEKALFPISAVKTQGPATEVTAFNIQLSHQALQITEDRLAELRNNYQSATSLYSKAGIINYVESVNPSQGHSLE